MLVVRRVDVGHVDVLDILCHVVGVALADAIVTLEPAQNRKLEMNQAPNARQGIDDVPPYWPTPVCLLL